MNYFNLKDKKKIKKLSKELGVDEMVLRVLIFMGLQSGEKKNKKKKKNKKNK